MKKVLTLLAIMAIAMGMVFAVEGNGGASSSTVDGVGSATMEVTLNLSGDLKNYYEIGFSTAPVTSVPTDGTITQKTTIALDDSTGADGNIKNSDEVYVYWVIKGDTVDLTLSTGDGLKSDSSGADVEWKAVLSTPTSGTLDAATATSADSVSASIIGINGESESGANAGSAKLDISTVNLLTTADVKGNYTGTLTLTVAAAE